MYIPCLKIASIGAGPMLTGHGNFMGYGTKKLGKLSFDKDGAKSYATHIVYRKLWKCQASLLIRIY